MNKNGKCENWSGAIILITIFSVCFFSESLISQNSDLNEIGRWSYGACRAVATRGDTVFVGNGLMFQILDVSNPSQPRLIGEVRTKGVVNAIAIAGTYAFLLSPFQIVDFSNPSSPKFLKDLLVGTSPLKLKICGSLAFVGDFAGRIYVLDIHNPLNPIVVSSMLASGEIVGGIAVEGSYLFATTANGYKVDIFSIANIDTPSVVGHWGTIGGGQALVYGNGYLYIADGAYSSLRILDVAAPSNPMLVSSLTISGSITDISVEDSLVYLSRQEDGFAAVNATNKFAPYLSAVIKSKIPFAYPYSHANSPGVAYVASDVGLWTLSLTSATSVTTASFFPTSSVVQCVGVDSTNHAYLGTNKTGIKILDCSDPTNPILEGTFAIPASIEELQVLGKEAFALSDSNNFYMLDISHPDSVKEFCQIAFQDTPITAGQYWFSQSFAISGKNIFVGRRSRRFYRISVSDSSHPSVTFIGSSAGDILAIQCYGHYLFTAEADSGVRIYDLQQQPISLVGLIKAQYTDAVSILGNKLIAIDDGNLDVYDLTIVSQPAFLGGVRISLGTSTALCSGMSNIEFLTSADYLFAVDLTNPANPSLVYSETACSGKPFSYGYGFGNFSLMGNKVFLATLDAGLSILQNNLVSGIRGLDRPADATKFVLYQNYPNPFNNQTTICYYLDRTQHVRLALYNLLGQIIRVVIDGVQTSGTHQVNIDADGLSSGIYFCTLQTTTRRATKTLVYLK